MLALRVHIFVIGVESLPYAHDPRKAKASAALDAVDGEERGAAP